MSQPSSNKDLLLDPNFLHQLRAEKARRSLHSFIRYYAWPILQPATPFKDNWHIGAICLPAKSMITTDLGKIAIADIVRQRLKVKVLSFNHQTECQELREITDWMESPGKPLLIFKLSNEKSLELTYNHPVFVDGRGYVRADQIRVGDVFMQAVWKTVPSQSCKNAWRVLFSHVFRKVKGKATELRMPGLWRPESVGKQKALPTVLCKKAVGRELYSMPTMWDGNISEPICMESQFQNAWSILQSFVLWPVLHWQKQPGIYRREESGAVSVRFSQNEEANIGTRLQSLLSLFGRGEDGCPSYRSEQGEQRSVELGGSVQEVSQPSKGNGSGNFDILECAVESIEQSLRIPDSVFNIEVDGNHNYFAESVLVHNCEHLEAVKQGQIRRLLINIPFRMLKSSIVSHAFPAWDWIDDPSRQYLTASYAKDIATRDAVDSRRIIESPAYQSSFGDRFKLTSDQNVKSRYENDKRGMRTVTSTDGAGTGFGGDIRIVDDPVSAKDADSALALATSIEWWKSTMVTRANDPSTGAAIIVHQRLNSNDLTGYLLAEESGWEHLVLPFRYDPELRKTTSLGFQDPRTTAGELIHPARIPEDIARELEKSLGAYHVNAQLQQNPEPRGGVIFMRDCWKFWKELPDLEETVISVDCTFKGLQSSDFVAIQVWGRKGANHYLRHRVKEHLGFSATCAAIKAVKAKFPEAIAVLIEDKANGSAVIETMSSEIGGILEINPEGGKVARAYAMQPDQEAGNLWLPDPSIDPDIETYLTELSRFPGVPHDDETDATTQYVNWARVRVKSMGMHDWMRQQAEAAAEKRKAA